MLEKYTGRVFDSATYTDEAYDGENSEWLFLNQYPVTALTTIKTRDDNNVETTLASTDYRLESVNGRVYRLGAGRGRLLYDPFGYVSQPDWGVSPCWPSGFQNILVTYTAGYTAQTMPVDLQQIMYMLVDVLFFEVKDGGSDPNVVSENLGDYSYTRAAQTLSTNERIAMIANYYRRVWG